jgi:hypothetical protein
MAVAEERVDVGPLGKRLLWAIVACLIAAHVVAAYLLFDPKPFIGGDNAAYMTLAESLETGQGYRDLYLPDAPKHAQYPPFYPTILAVTRALGGELIAFKILSLIFTTASVVFLFLLARSRLGWLGGLAIMTPFALNPVLLYYSHWVLSEAPFVLLTLLALWASEEMLTSNRRLTLAVAAALLAYLTRAAGLPLLVALVIALGWRRSWRKLAYVGAAIVIVVGAWWVWGRLAASGSAQVYSSNLFLVNPYAPELGYVGPADLIARAFNNIRLYTVEVLPQSLGGVGSGGGLALLPLLAALLIVALSLISWVRDIRRIRVVELYTALYAALICLWPQVWTDRRFLLPLLPILILQAAAGIVWCFEFLRVKRPVWALPALGALLVLLAVPDHVRSVGFNQRCMGFYRQGDRLACYPPPWRAFAQTAFWVRENTAEDAIVVNRKPRLFYYFSGRRGDVYPFTAEDDEMLAFLDGIGADYVVVAWLSQTTSRYLVPVIQSMPEHFQPVHRITDTEPTAYVLAYRPTSASRLVPEEPRNEEGS